MGSPVLFDKSMRRTTNPLEVESNVRNFTFISTYILSLLSFLILPNPLHFPLLMENPPHHLSPGVAIFVFPSKTGRGMVNPLVGEPNRVTYFNLS
jgi:hypothetical protein